MSHEIVKFDVNNAISLEYSSYVKEEFHDEYYPDNKVCISETTIIDPVNISSNEINEYMRNDEMGKCEMLSEDYIKTDLPSSEVNDTITSNLKIEEGICPADIQIESNNELLFCNHCHTAYQDYCTKCRVLVHILNKRPCHNTYNRIRELPKYVLEARESVGHLGIFSLKVIPEDVRFGPFAGLNSTGLPLRIKGGRVLVSDDKSEHLNWMQCINPAKNIYEQNLFPFQYEEQLYYCSTRRIQQGEELLVYFGEEYKDNLLKYVEMDFVPITKTDVENVFACTFCCLGFSSKEYLAEHKVVSHSEAKEIFSVEELAQCPFCKIYMEAKEYFEHHMDYCYETNDGYCVVPTPEVHELAVEERSSKRHIAKRWKREIYKCTQCQFRTMYSAEFKHHINEHCEVKIYKCEICNKRYKAKESLKAHVVKNHVNSEERCVKTHTTKHLKENHCKCIGCGFKTTYKSHLEKNKKVKHLKQYDYKCTGYEYMTNIKSNLELHVDAKHRKQKNYKCAECQYKTSYKASLERHIKIKHLKQYDYKCTECEFKTIGGSNLKAHIKAKHLNLNDYKCTECEYKTNHKADLERHIKAKHLKQNDYKCTECEFKTNYRATLKIHVKVHHLKKYNCNYAECEYKTLSIDALTSLIAHREAKAKRLKQDYFKCVKCKYVTNHKGNLDRHIKRKHHNEYDYKCLECEYSTSFKSILDKHIKVKHLNQSNKCKECEYTGNRKADLEKHISTKHLNQNDYKCRECEFMTNYKGNLERHMKRKHL